MRRRVLEGILVAATALTWAARSDATFPIFGCCRNISAFGFDICANTGPVDCPAPGTFEIGRLCDGQCPPPNRPDEAASTSQAEGAQTAGVGVAVFSNTALSILGVPSAGAPALGEAALVALSLALAALGVTAARQRR